METTMNEMMTAAPVAEEKKAPRRRTKVAAEEAVVVTEPAAAPAVEEVPIPAAEIPAPAPKKGRGRPAFDRSLMMKETIEALRKEFPNQAIFSRSDLMQLTLPVSYVLNFVKVGATKVRGLYVIPAQYRNLWAGYAQMLQKELKEIYNH
jgi:hypothetical protein